MWLENLLILSSEKSSHRGQLRWSLAGDCQLRWRAISSVGKSAPLIRVRSLVRIQDSPRGYSSVGRALPLQGRCQRFESAYLQPIRGRGQCNCGVNAIDHELSEREILFFRFQKNKGLWWIPRHPKTMKGVLTDETLQ